MWCENYGTREKHAIRKGMRSVVEKFVSATNLLLVPTQQIIGDGLVGDTVAGKTRQACLVTLVDRKSRFVIGGKANKKNAREVSRIIICALRGLPVKTITPDRGMEFARHAEVTSALQVPFYFPPPHQPWQKGINENTNGLSREYFPKGQDLTDISQECIQEVFDELNMRPCKCLSYRTPYEVFYKKPLHLT